MVELKCAVYVSQIFPYQRARITAYPVWLIAHKFIFASNYDIKPTVSAYFLTSPYCTRPYATLTTFINDIFVRATTVCYYTRYGYERLLQSACRLTKLHVYSRRNLIKEGVHGYFRRVRLCQDVIFRTL